MLPREGSVQAEQEELSKDRLVPAGKGSFTACAIALTTCAAHRMLSAQQAEFPCAQHGSRGRDGAFGYWE